MFRLVLVMTAATLLAGCAATQPFRSSKRMDLAPFAETTITLATEIEYGLTETSRAIHLRRYWGDPVLAEHRKEWDRVRRLLKGVVAYSVELTMLGNSTLGDPERNRALANFLQPLAEPAMSAQREALHITPAGLDSILEDIRDQKTFIKGIAAAQPIIDEVSRIADLIFDDVELSLDHTAQHLMARIDSANGEVVKYDSLLRHARYRVLTEVTLLYAYRNTRDPEALAEMFRLDPQLKELVESEQQLTLDEINAIEERLVRKLDIGKQWGEQIGADVDIYHSEQRALTDLYTDAALQLKRARATIIIWSRAHRNLARGITDPAQINIFDVTKKAVRAVL